MTFSDSIIDAEHDHVKQTAVDHSHHPISKEQKECGHYCYPSNLKKCCSCEDLRPISEDGGYEAYIDGIGWTTTAARDDGYCPVCNTKNYDRWVARMEQQLKKKQQEDEARKRKEYQEQAASEEDRLRNSDKTHGKIDYSNGDVYVCDLKDGNPHGKGRMEYALEDVLNYDGEWVDGKHEGFGKKVFYEDPDDGVNSMWYEGWWKDGMMNGQGVFHQDARCGNNHGRIF